MDIIVCLNEEDERSLLHRKNIAQSDMYLEGIFPLQTEIDKGK